MFQTNVAVCTVPGNVSGTPPVNTPVTATLSATQNAATTNPTFVMPPATIQFQTPFRLTKSPARISPEQKLAWRQMQFDNLASPHPLNLRQLMSETKSDPSGLLFPIGHATLLRLRLAKDPALAGVDVPKNPRFRTPALTKTQVFLLNQLFEDTGGQHSAAIYEGHLKANRSKYGAMAGFTVGTIQNRLREWRRVVTRPSEDMDQSLDETGCRDDPENVDVAGACSTQYLSPRSPPDSTPRSSGHSTSHSTSHSTHQPERSSPETYSEATEYSGTEAEAETEADIGADTDSDTDFVPGESNERTYVELQRATPKATALEVAHASADADMIDYGSSSIDDRFDFQFDFRRQPSVDDRFAWLDSPGYAPAGQSSGHAFV